MRARRALTVVGIAAIAMIVAGVRGEAHKPITSPYSYNEHVFPILRDRCGACHVPGGVAPMSLMTHAAAVPWGESIRAEVMAGHMPPWPVETNRAHFRNGGGLTARELNVLLTWVTGGTPVGDVAKIPAPVALDARWPLGKPDLELPLNPVTLGAETQEQTTSFVIATGTTERRWVRAVDVLPGTPAIVRSATIAVRDEHAAGADGGAAERLLALWLPGETPVPVNAGAAFELPAGAQIVLLVRYKKTWEYERKEMLDRSRLGIYFAEDRSTVVNALALDVRASMHTPTDGPATAVPVRSLDRDTRAVAIHAETALRDVRLKIEAARPDGSIEELITFRPQPDWSRRYWFAEPIALPKGTHINVTVSRDEEADLQPPAPATAQARTPTEPATLRVTLDVIEP